MMKKSIGASIFGALATLLVLLPTPAAAQCNCSLSTLIGTQANVRLVDQAGNGPIAGPATVGSGVEFPGAGPALGLPGPPRMNINYGANSIRVDFVGSGAQSYAGAVRFRFGNLHPAQPAGCSGPVTISGIQVQTNKPGAGFVTAGATFGPDSVTVPFAPPSGTTDWLPGQWITVTLTYACAPPPPPPVGFNPCCPPWNSTQLQSMLVYQGTGGIGAPYTLRFIPTPQLHAQMNAYMNYLHTLGMGFTTILVNFQLSDAGTGASPVPGTVITNQPVVWSGSGTPTPNFFASGLMSVNRWYRIQTTIILAGPNGSTFLPRECLISFVDVRIQLIASARSQGAPAPQSAPATLQFRLADGRIVEQPISR